MKIVVLTSETPGNIWLVNQLLINHDVRGIVIERTFFATTAEEKLEQHRKMVRRYGYARTFNKLLFNRLRATFLAARDSQIVRDAFFPSGTPAYCRQVPTIVVDSVNEPDCIRFIKTYSPEVLAVCGTGILKPAVFELAPRGTVNIHAGITPEYRSADPIFWALYQGEPEKVGVTVHFVDAGIDTGRIIHQEPVPVYRNDSLSGIYVRCIRRGAELYTRALRAIEAGAVRTIDRRGVRSRAFLSVDLGIVQYAVFRWRFWRLSARLERDQSAETRQTRIVA